MIGQEAITFPIANDDGTLTKKGEALFDALWRFYAFAQKRGVADPERNAHFCASCGLSRGHEDWCRLEAVQKILRNEDEQSSE